MANSKEISLLLLLTCFGIVRQDVKVATYSTGKVNTEAHESLSFWIKSDQRAYIRYSHGKEADDVELNWMGRDSLQQGETGFKVRFPDPDTSCLYIFREGTGLKVMDRGGKYRRSYVWENENKAGDSSIFCPICVRDEKEAMNMLQKYFFR